MKKRPFYRIVAAEKGFKRDGRFLEVLGTYDPKTDPPALTLREDKVRKWIENGAQPTRIARVLIDKKIPGFIQGREQAKRAKIQEARRKRKARAKQYASATKEKKVAKFKKAKAETNP